VRERIIHPRISNVSLAILIGAIAKFALHMYMAPGYGFFFDELYTNALSRHLAFGYVDLPPLVPALVALSRLLLGDSLPAMHIVPALAGSFTLVFACLIAKEFGGKLFAVALTALGFIIVPGWLMVDSIFGYDSIDQLILAAFLFTLVRFLRTGNHKLWIVLGFLAGIACLTKMTILFLGPGFLIALLASKYRKELLTPWPWLGAGICLALVSPYLIWQFANHWPTIEYWRSYGTTRVYQAPLQQYVINVSVYVSSLLLPLWLIGLYRIFRRLDGVDYSFLGLLFGVTLVQMFLLHATPRMILELFIPLLAAGAVFTEEIVTGIRWGKWVKAPIAIYMLVVGVVNVSFSLPVIPMDLMPAATRPFQALYQPLREFNFGMNNPPIFLIGRVGWEDLVRQVADVYNALPPEDRAQAGIYTNLYMTAGAIDQFGPRYGLPHAVSGHLTYYLWGPGYSWNVMIIVSGRTNVLSVLFDRCEPAGATQQDFIISSNRFYFFVCRKPVVPAATIWSTAKSFY
jgi:4-amino-4-deoxy-L-arabinose transferase-like glycosyltransferase